jgi:predicted membrane protein
MIIAADSIVRARAAILPLMVCPPLFAILVLRYIHRAIKRPLARLAIWVTACVGIVGSELLQLRIYEQISGTANRMDDPFVTGVILCENLVGLILGFVFLVRLRKKI